MIHTEKTKMCSSWNWVPGYGYLFEYPGTRSEQWRTETKMISLNNLKTVKDSPQMSIGEQTEPLGRLSNGPIHDPRVFLTPKPGGRNAPFQVSAKRLEIHENVTRAHSIIHRLATESCYEQSHSFRRFPKIE